MPKFQDIFLIPPLLKPCKTMCVSGGLCMGGGQAISFLDGNGNGLFDVINHLHD